MSNRCRPVHWVVLCRGVSTDRGKTKSMKARRYISAITKGEAIGIVRDSEQRVAGALGIELEFKALLTGDYLLRYPLLWLQGWV